ncbi:Flp family type IVb pilin [Litorimonas sp. RW-G-Af-16]|uniref:Flp family type IVb pilin n=1 Tax=Litorimonas sp. RW-G-Af-16 TaxID=3241168 RepID=UPI00390C44E2
MTHTIKKFFECERGATAIEYALVASLIAVAIISGAALLGTALDTKFDSVATKVDNVA